jgi:hypothetical protein
VNGQGHVIGLSTDQCRLALHIVRDLITRRTLGGNSVPPGTYRLYHDLEVASVYGTESVAALKESVPEEYIDTTEAAAILNCSTRWVRQIRSDLEGRNISGRWIFRRQTVVDYADMKGGAQ